MFKRNDIKKIALLFECEEHVVQSAIYSGSHYLKSSGINTYTIARMISILSDKLFREKIKETTILLPEFGMRSIAIKKYRSDIIHLYNSNFENEDFGYGSIAKYLKTEYKVEVSRQTIKTYIQNYLIWSQNNG